MLNTGVEPVQETRGNGSNERFSTVSLMVDEVLIQIRRVNLKTEDQ